MSTSLVLFSTEKRSLWQSPLFAISTFFQNVYLFQKDICIYIKYIHMYFFLVMSLLQEQRASRMHRLLILSRPHSQPGHPLPDAGTGPQALALK